MHGTGGQRCIRQRDLGIVQRHELRSILLEAVRTIHLHGSEALLVAATRPEYLDGLDRITLTQPDLLLQARGSEGSTGTGDDVNLSSAVSLFHLHRDPCTDSRPIGLYALQS